MTATWRAERLPELVRAMAGRPWHEALRGHVTELLRSGFSAPYSEIGHEVYLLDGTGRIDTLWGATVIELKTDLRRELDDVLARLPAYLADAKARSSSPRPVTGLATDGATFIAYALRDDGTLRELARHSTDPARPDEWDMPGEVDRWEGQLPRRDAGDAEASRALTHSRMAWPRARTLIGVSPYRERFRNGASIFPRRFFIVDPEPVSRLGGRRDAPRMRGRAGALDKHPWTTVEPPRGPVEREFLRQVILGETIAPLRLLEPVTAVIPLNGTTMLDAASASEAGYRHLAAWLRDAEAKWSEQSNKGTDGEPRMMLGARLDHMRNLFIQAGQPTIRVLYTKAGTRLSATVIAADDVLVDHKAYWAPVRLPEEAHYLAAIINSAAVLAKVTDLQPHGQRDKRDFDNLVWTLPIPEYDPAEPLHQDFAAAATWAEAVAAAGHFTTKRRAIRAALAEDGVAAEMEALVDALLPP